MDGHGRVEKRAFVRGRVMDPDGKPVPDFKLMAINQDNRETVYFYLQATTDAEGNFTFNAVRPGQYSVVPDRWAYRVSVSHEDLPHQPATVTEGQTAAVGDVVLSKPFMDSAGLKVDPARPASPSATDAKATGEAGKQLHLRS